MKSRKRSEYNNLMYLLILTFIGKHWNTVYQNVDI